MNYFLIVTLFCAGSCNINAQVLCNENIFFEKSFMKCIDKVESYTFKRKDADSMQVSLDEFKQSLDSMSAYTKVNFTLLANYEFRYANLEEFRKEKKKWLNWYEQNKCKNLTWNK